METQELSTNIIINEQGGADAIKSLRDTIIPSIQTALIFL
jgi:hypothetical protein